MLRLLSFLGLPLLAMCAGASLVIQATLNTSLRSCLASWSWATLVSYLGGSVTMVIILILTREPWPGRAAAAAVPWSGWIGGVFGAFYIAMSIVLLPRLGAAAVVAFVVAGQMFIPSRSTTMECLASASILPPQPTGRRIATDCRSRNDASVILSE